MSNTTFIKAAYQILKEKQIPLTAEEITKIALDKKLIKTSGKTPAATMGAKIYVDIKRNGNNSLFVKVGKGKFGLREWQKETQQNPFRRGTFKFAAYEVLKLENRPLSIQEITEIAKQRNLFVSTGKTPIATMGAQLYTDIKKFGSNSYFIQLAKNKFGLREWNIEVLKDEIKNQNNKEIPVDEKKRSIVGDPINFEGLIYGPLNENGVIFLFSKIHDRLGIKIEAIQATYPDAKARRKTDKGWEDIWIEFEFKSSQFKTHKHDPKDCDIIVCWEHDWKECPIEVIELKSVIRKLKE